ncbi:alcohol dehydrogenase (NAD) [Rhizoctonia solani]|uniref:Alcohol dehydrogenase (NAD) n=1 Tax=Rhizoctonia solani TaxID=456999 RepID=A0A8H7LFA1_9AGAM|nr:alcohol dehydrogenase (NAD) [Rhizoctonia solani]
MASPTLGKVAVVTGASSGIGKATSITLSKAGYRVVLVARREAELNATAQECPSETLVTPGDVTDEVFAAKVFEEAVKKFGRVDILFNVSYVLTLGCYVMKPRLLINAFPPSLERRRVIDVNLTSAFIFTREAFKVFKTQTPRGGRIINNGSIAAYAPRPMAVAYTTSKHAITGLTKSISLDGRNFDIACTQIDIGNAQTQMVADHGPTGQLQPNGQNVVEGSIDVQHVADAILHIANLPLNVTVLFMNIMATTMPFVGRG